MADEEVDVPSEVAESVAPDSVSEEVPQAIFTVVSRLEHLADRMTEVIEHSAPETHPEHVADSVEEARDDIPIRKPWTHRVPFRKRDE